MLPPRGSTSRWRLHWRGVPSSGASSGDARAIAVPPWLGSTTDRKLSVGRPTHLRAPRSGPELGFAVEHAVGRGSDVRTISWSVVPSRSGSRPRPFSRSLHVLPPGPGPTPLVFHLRRLDLASAG